MNSHHLHHPHNKFERKLIENEKAIPNDQKKKKSKRKVLLHSLEELERLQELREYLNGDPRSS